MDQIALFNEQHNQQENLTQDWVQSHRPKILDDDDDETHRGLASRLYLLCLALLRRVFLQQNPSKKGSNALREELGKFYLWGQELADGKLDQALEQSEDIKKQVLDSLRSVGRSLLRAYSSPNTIIESTLPEDTRQELSCLIDQAQAIISIKELYFGQGDVGESSGSDTDDGDDTEGSYNSSLVHELAQQTIWLSQLSTAIEQNYVRAINAQQKKIIYPPVVPFSVSGPAQFYVGLVQDKFQKAGRKLVERFGEANWQRHVNIRNQLDSATSAAEEPAAHSVFRPHSAFHDSGIGTSVPARTTYAASHTSFRSSASETARGSIRVPQTPIEVDAGKPFQCFLCKMTLSNIRNRIDWKMHVFSDLQPYICTFLDCPDELAQFPSRAAWAEHEFSQHRTTQSWKCPECHEKYTSDSEWEHHVHTQHKLELAGKDLQVAKNMALVVEEAESVDGEQCPLCRIILREARRGYVKHVGSHMEDIALITLPRNVEEDEDSNSGSSDRDTHRKAVGEASGQFTRSPSPESTHLVPPQSKLIVDEERRRHSSAPQPQSQLQPLESLEISLIRLRQHYPNDNFESCMRDTLVSVENGVTVRVKPNEPQPANVKIVSLPRIRCLDCPGKRYHPDLDFGATDFEVHLQHKIHRARVEGRVEMARTNHDRNIQAEGTTEWEDSAATKSSEDGGNSMHVRHRHSQSRSPSLPVYDSKPGARLQKLENLERQMGAEESQERLGEKSLVEAGNKRQRGNKSRLKCPHCSKTYIHEGFLKRHVTTHVPSGSLSVPGATTPLQAPSRPSRNQSHLASETRGKAFVNLEQERIPRELIERSSPTPVSNFRHPSSDQATSVDQPTGSRQYNPCEGCGKNRVKCDGARPCAMCVQAQRPCRDPPLWRHQEDSEPPARGIADPENSALETPRWDGAGLQLPSEDIQEQDFILGDEPGGTSLPETGKGGWENLNYEDKGPSDSISRPRTSKPEPPLVEARGRSPGSPLVPPYSVSHREAEGEARRRGPFLLNGSFDEDGNDFKDRIADSRSFNKGNPSTGRGAFSNISAPAATEQGEWSQNGGQRHHCLASPDCTYWTDRHTDLKRHYKAKHHAPRDEYFRCSYTSCRIVLKRKDHLRDHCKRVHYRDLPIEYGGTGSKLSH